MSGVQISYHPPSYPKIWFLRHGQTEWNAEGRIQGRLNSDLTARGLEDAQAQRRLMAPVLESVLDGRGGLYASPLGRAQQTAQIVFAPHAFTTDARLSEIDTGAWEGLLKADVAPEGAGIDTYLAAPDGEGLRGLQTRVRDFLSDLKGPSILVSHGILGTVLRAEVLGLDRAGMTALSNLQGCAYLLEGETERLLHSA